MGFHTASFQLWIVETLGIENAAASLDLGRGGSDVPDPASQFHPTNTFQVLLHSTLVQDKIKNFFDFIVFSGLRTRKYNISLGQGRLQTPVFYFFM